MSASPPAPPPSLLRRLRRTWALPLAGALVFGLVAALLRGNYLAAETLRENLLAQHTQQARLHASSLGHFLSSASEALTTVAESNAVGGYFAGRDLGMTPEYGLALSQVAITTRLRRLVTPEPSGAPSAFVQVTLFDQAGQVVAEAGSAPAAALAWDEVLDPSVTEAEVRLGPRGSGLVVVRAHWWKGRHVGHLLGWLRPESVAGALAGEGRPGNGPLAFLVVDAEGRSVHLDQSKEAALAPPSGLGQLAADGRAVELDGPRGALLAARVPVPPSRFTLILLRPAADLLGGQTPRSSAVGLGAVALAILLVVGVALWLNTSALVLRARLDESLRREQEVGEKHAALEREVAERRRFEAANALLGMATEQAAEAMVVTDTAGLVEYVNPAFLRATGLSPEQVLGRSAVALLGERGRPALGELTRAVLAGQRWRGEVAWERADGALLEVEMVVSPVRDAAGATVSYVAVARDVTEERQLRERLRHAQKLEAVGTLAGGVAHDFNNLLTAVKGYTGAALDALSDGDPEQARQDLAEIDRAASRGAELVRQLLAFGRKQVLRPQRLDLDEAVAGVEKLLRRLAGEKALVELRPGSAPWRVQVDPGQLEQVLVNLVVNARDALPRGGRITIATAPVALGEAEARRYTEGAPGEYVRLTVSDDGEGMAEATLAHVFEPFFTTKARGQGTGLGLSTVYGIVRQSRGFMGVTSAPGAGTRFDVYLPRDVQAVDEGAAVPAPAAPRRPSGPSGRSDQVLLVVEDEPQVRALLQRQLRGEGYTVLAAADGEEAVGLLGAEGGRIDLLITDLVMPRMGGHELSRRFGARYPGAPVIFMSGYAEVAGEGGGGAIPEGCFLQKPFELADLAALVRRLLDAARAG